MVERWKSVKGFEGKYLVSDHGRIYSMYRQGCNGRMLKLQLDKCGYPYAILSDGKRKKYTLVHRAVAAAFVKNKKNKPQINHLDGVKTNNYATNLEYCTAAENIAHSYDSGLRGPSYIKIRQYDKDGRFIREYKSIKFAAETNGISCSSDISRCAKGKLKLASGFMWRYADTKGIGFFG